MGKIAKVDAAFAELKAYWDRLLDIYTNDVGLRNSRILNLIQSYSECHSVVY